MTQTRQSDDYKPLIPSPWETAVTGWRILRKMSTALWLLCILAFCTLIGTIVPQKGISETTLQQWRAGEAGPGVGITEFFDKIELFNIFSSWWFLTVTALLFISLTGCLLPRIRTYLRTMNALAKPTRNLQRLASYQRFTWNRKGRLVATSAEDPVSASVVPPTTMEAGDSIGSIATDHSPAPDTSPAEPKSGDGVQLGDTDAPLSPADIQALTAIAVEQAKRKNAWWALPRRIATVTNDDNTTQIAVEAGHAREGASLVFHLSFYFLLIGVFWSVMFGFTGHVNIPVGKQFVDTPLGYTSMQAGALWKPSFFSGTITKVDKFAVDYVPGQPFTPEEYRSYLTFTNPSTGETKHDVLKVNEPVTFGNITYYQRAFGFAPTVKLFKNGELIYEETLMLEAAGPFWSGRGKVSLGTDNLPQVGIEVMFMPDASFKDGAPVALSPEPKNPRMLVSIYVSPNLGLDRTVPIGQLVWSQRDISTQTMVLPGQTAQLQGDSFTVEWAGLDYWTGLQASVQPARPLLLASAVLLLLGLIPSLYSYRRKFWITISATSVEVGGYALQRQEAFSLEFEELVANLKGSLVKPKDLL